MFVPSLLHEARKEVLWTLIEQNPLGAVIAQRGSQLDANHLPFEFDADAGILRTHISKANPFWDELIRGEEVLVIFQGPNHYISPTWQPGAMTHGRVAPSWNYAVAHVYGTLDFVEDEAWLRNHLAALAAKGEAHNPRPWTLDVAPADFVGALLPRIVGIQIAITSLIGKSQACQQYSPGTRAGVVAGLNGQGTERAGAMAQVIEAVAPVRA